MLRRLRDRQEWQFFAALPRADRPLAWAWWAVLILRGLLLAAFAVAMGVLVAAVDRGRPLGGPLRRASPRCGGCSGSAIATSRACCCSRSRSRSPPPCRTRSSRSG